MKKLTYKTRTRTILDLVNLFEAGRLNLNPEFQRNSVWTSKDRSKLIDSVLKNYPLPAIFLYQRDNNGKVINDVIDGKQRLETVLMFMGVLRGKGFRRFSIKTQIDDNVELKEISWNYLQRNGKQPMLEMYEISTIEVDGEISDIIDVFVRINSTGKPLTTAEKQHAKYFKDSPLLKTASSIAEKYKEYFIKTGVLSPGQVSRMKHIELVCEIMISIDQNDVINKKAALDKIMGKTFTGVKISKLKEKATKVLNRIGKVFPHLNETRFKQLSDFYILAVLIAKYESEGLILTDKKRNKLAWNLLKEFSNHVDTTRLKQRRVEGVDDDYGIYREYLLTVQQATDEISQRRKRMEILDNLLRNLFEVKDKQRGFTKEQRRIIWNSTKERKCKECGKILTWDDFTIDHIDPHSKGGRTEIENSSLMCRKHNSAKGNRLRKRKTLK